MPGRTTTQRAPEVTVAFVDLAGFAALTEVHGDEHAVDLVEQFEGFAAAALGPGDRLVKMLGDAAMFRFDGPAAALAGLRRLVGTCLNAPGFPLPQAGVHHGPVIERGGDIFGRTVNLAARVADQATGGQVLVTTGTAAVAREAGLPVRPLGVFRPHNMSADVDLFEVEVVRAPGALSVDPVCRMRIDEGGGHGSLRHAGIELWFCSLSCAELFAADPDEYSGALAV